MVKKFYKTILMTVGSAVAALMALAEGSLNCNTGGLANGWQCSVSGVRSAEWCQHRANQICDPQNPWENNYFMYKDIYRIVCVKPGNVPPSTV